MIKVKVIISLLALYLLIGSGFQNDLKAQSTYFKHNTRSESLINRYEIKTGNLRNSLFADIRPYRRDQVANLVQSLDTFDLAFSEADQFNLDYLAHNNLPWADKPINNSEKPVLKHFYKSKANLYQVHEDHFSLFINPGLYLKGGISSQSDDLLFTNKRAVEVRGIIDEQIGFYTYLSENQIQPAQHQLDFYRKKESYPGASYTKDFGDNGVDFFKPRGYITFSPSNSISMQFGHDKNFIGNGQRSLLLSDYAPPYTFLKINTDVWRFNYQNIFARMTDNYGSVVGQDQGRPLPPKYSSIHYLSIDILDNLNLGLFESVVFHDNRGAGRNFDVRYLNPVIFYRAIEQQVGDADKMLVGLNLQYLPLQQVELYGQFTLNEFRFDDLRSGNGHYANKYGYQAGFKYIDAIGINNLDLQAEYNRVRPYNYTHFSVSGEYPVNNWSHYNHELAHPLGANFSELIGNIKFQPFSKLRAGIKFTHANYGADSSKSNWGGNIFKDYNNFEQELGNEVGQGVTTQLNIVQGWVTYQIRHNLFLELDVRYREVISEIGTRSNDNLFYGMALRMNLARSEWLPMVN